MRVFLKFLLLLILSSCSYQQDFSSSFHHEYSEIEHLKLSYLDVFKVEKERYYVYYYQELCYYCIGIKSKMIEYALNHDGDIYFINIEKDEGFLAWSREDTLFTNDPLYAFSNMTPQLSKIENGYISETYLGDIEIINYLELGQN